MREGRGLSAREFEDLMKKTGSNSVIVDWVVAFGLPMEIIMLIYRNGELEHMIPWQHVPKIIKNSNEPPPQSRRETAEDGTDKTQEKEGMPDRQPEIDAWVNKSMDVKEPLFKKYRDDREPVTILKNKILPGLIRLLRDFTKPRRNSDLLHALTIDNQKSSHLRPKPFALTPDSSTI